MSERTSARYLNIRQQKDVIDKLVLTDYILPWRESVYLRKGSYISALSLLASTVVFWRSSYRGFNLFRYGRARSSSFALCCLSGVQGCFLYQGMVQHKLYEFYANEDPWFYAKRAAIAHNCGLSLAFSSSTALTFVYASRSALVPIMHTEFPEGTKCKTLRYIARRLKPYYKSIATVWISTTLLMTFVGYMALEQRQAVLLRAANRKTISRIENNRNDNLV